MRILARNGLKVIEKNIWESYNESEVTHISIRIFWPFLLNWNTFRDRLLKAWKYMKFAEFSMCKHCVKGVQMRSLFWSAFSRVRTENGDFHTDKKTPAFRDFSHNKIHSTKVTFEIT